MTFNNLPSRLLTVALALGAGVATCSPQLAAQQVVCFSFDGVKNISGKDSTGEGSKTGVRVGGKTVMIDTKAGDSPATCASKLDAALTKAGFKTKKASSTVVCVEAGPGGAPLTSGGGIGTTDSGLTGIDVSVMKPPKAPPPPTPPKKPVKQQGATVPQVKPGQTASRDGWIQIDVEVYRWQEGRWVLTTVQVQIRIQRGATSNQINEKIRDALIKAGFLPRSIHVPSLFNNTLTVPSFGLERDKHGNPVQHVRYLQDIPTELLQLELTAGRTDFRAGAVNLGEGSPNTATAPYMNIEGAPFLGQPFAMVMERATPRGQALLLVGPRLIFARVDGLAPGGQLFVEPATGFLLPGVVDMNGRATWGLAVPPNPRLVGLELFAQGACIASQSSLSDALQVKIGR